jgi:myo-inositol-1(or 4)-monophosphatase
MLGSDAAKGLEGHGASGDATFAIDEVAERKVGRLLETHAEIAYYTEDRGLVDPGDAKYLLIIDPIDGTRPAAAGLESCCVSVAAAPLRGRAAGDLRMGDVLLGVVDEIKNRAVFTALRGGGARIEVEGSPFEPRLSTKSSLGQIFWTAGYRGRPAEQLTTVLSELIDLSSVDGGYFDLGSATFSITRVLKGEMDTYIDVGQRMVEEVEEVRRSFLEVGHGAILNNYPYDLAAAALIAGEAGAVVSDAYGRTLDDYPLVPSGGGGQMSSIVSGNRTLHEALLANIDSGMTRLAKRYGAACSGGSAPGFTGGGRLGPH